MQKIDLPSSLPMPILLLMELSDPHKADNIPEPKAEVSPTPPWDEQSERPKEEAMIVILSDPVVTQFPLKTLEILGEEENKVLDVPF